MSTNNLDNNAPSDELPTTETTKIPYTFSRGDGPGIVQGGSVTPGESSVDRVLLGEGVTEANIRLTKSDHHSTSLDLHIMQGGEFTDDKLTLAYTLKEGFEIERLVFNNNQQIMLKDIKIERQGTEGDDTLAGATEWGNNFRFDEGTDHAYGGAESDDYYFNIGDGDNTMRDNGTSDRPGSIDRIMLGAGITEDKVRLVVSDRLSASLELQLLDEDDNPTEDKLTLEYALRDNNTIEQLVFIDEKGDTYEKALKDISVTHIGDSADDTLNGVDGYENNFQGGAGDDFLYGYAEADTYTFNRGGGHDHIRDQGVEGGTVVKDRIVFGEGISRKDIWIKASESDPSTLVLTLLNDGKVTEDTLSIESAGQNRFAIELLEFADGQTVNFSDIPVRPEPEPASERIETTLSGSDAKYASTWHSQSSGTMDASDLINLDAFRNNSEFSHIDGSGFAIVVIDSGLDLDHPFFGEDRNGDGISDRVVYHQDFTNEGDSSADSHNSAAHGTNVTSIAASSDENFDGVAPGADIIALQALSATEGNFAILEKALKWVVDNAEAYNIAAVNMSLGDQKNYNTLKSMYGIGDELARLEQMGVITVAAAGNSYGSFKAEGASYPAIDPSTIAVGAVFDAGTSGQLRWSDAVVYNAGADRLTPFSQRSDEVVDIFAPGAPIYGAAPGGSVDFMTGTSQASPVVAGAVLLAQQLAVEVLGRKLTMDEFNTAIRASGVEIIDGDDEDDSAVNTGDTYHRIDIEAMGQYIKNMARDETPVPEVDDGNESIDEAVAITVGVDRNGEIEVSFDKDWYSVSLEAGIKYTFSLTGQSLENPFLSLHKPSGTAIASNDDSQSGLDAEITYTPSVSGTYYLNTQASWDGIGTYTLGVVGVEPEPINDIAGDSSTTALLTDSQTSSIDFSGDKDWFKVNLETGHNYTFDVHGAGSGAGTLRDAQVRLYDSNGQLKGFDDDSGVGSDASLGFRPDVAGEYFVEVSTWDNSDQGSYTVQMHSEELVSDIADDTTTQATLSVGSNVDGEINFVTDRDWYAIELEAGTRYQFDLKGSASNKGTLEDPLLMLYNAAGVALGRNDDASDTSDSQLVFTADTAGTYYLSAAAYGTGEGTYNLSAEMLEPEMPAEPDPGTPGGETDVSNPYPINVGWNVGSILRQQNEIDWYSIQLVAGEKYQFDLQADNNVFGAAMRDPLLYLYDTTRSPLSEDNDSGTGLDSLMTFTAQTTGTYYLGATSADGTDTGSYTLRSQLLTQTVPPEGGDPGSDAPAVSSPYAIAVGANLISNLAVNAELDWYSIALQAGKTYRFDLEAKDYLSYSAVNDPLMYLYDTAKNPLKVNDNGGAGNNAALEFTASQTGVYYLGAASVEDSDLGVYNLKAQEVIDYSQVRDVTSISTRTNVYSSLSNEGEIDWFSVQLTAGQSYEFELNGSSPYTPTDISDAMLYLYDSAKNPMLEDDNSGPGNDALLSFTATTTGIYFIGVGSVQDDDLGGYGLHTSIV